MSATTGSDANAAWSRTSSTWSRRNGICATTSAPSEKTATARTPEGGRLDDGPGPALGRPRPRPPEVDGAGRTVPTTQVSASAKVST